MFLSMTAIPVVLSHGSVRLFNQSLHPTVRAACFVIVEPTTTASRYRQSSHLHRELATLPIHRRLLGPIGVSRVSGIEDPQVLFLQKRFLWGQGPGASRTPQAHSAVLGTWLPCLLACWLPASADRRAEPLAGYVCMYPRPWHLLHSTYLKSFSTDRQTRECSANISLGSYYSAYLYFVGRPTTATGVVTVRQDGFCIVHGMEGGGRWSGGGRYRPPSWKHHAENPPATIPSHVCTSLSMDGLVDCREEAGCVRPPLDERVVLYLDLVYSCFRYTYIHVGVGTSAWVDRRWRIPSTSSAWAWSAL